MPSDHDHPARGHVAARCARTRLELRIRLTGSSAGLVTGSPARSPGKWTAGNQSTASTPSSALRPHPARLLVTTEPAVRESALARVRVISTNTSGAAASNSAQSSLRAGLVVLQHSTSGCIQRKTVVTVRREPVNHGMNRARHRMCEAVQEQPWCAGVVLGWTGQNRARRNAAVSWSRGIVGWTALGRPTQFGEHIKRVTGGIARPVDEPDRQALQHFQVAAHTVGGAVLLSQQHRPSRLVMVPSSSATASRAAPTRWPRVGEHEVATPTDRA